MSSKARGDHQKMLALIGACLLVVQQAEHVLSDALELILERRDVNLAAQSASERKQTLGDFLMRLKRSTKVEHGLKERLFKFLEMRNTFVHNLSQVPGWDLKTEKGRDVAALFLIELAYAALGITALFVTLFSISAKDEYGEDLFAQEEKHEHEVMATLEKRLGPMARKLLAGRYHLPVLVHPSKARPK
jgi:hypothetical protein